jgi:hypothetical protein
MKRNYTPEQGARNNKKFGGWIVCGVALLTFAAGSLVTTGLTHMQQVRADNHRVFELRMYHCLPGKEPALESRFREHTASLLAKHNLKVVGYWVPEGASAWQDTFVFMLAHDSREEAKKNWEAFEADPAFQELLQAEKANKLVEEVEVTYMRPTDFSPMK